METLRHFAAGQVMKRVVARIIPAREKSLHTVIDSEFPPILTPRDCVAYQMKYGMLLFPSP